MAKKHRKSSAPTAPRPARVPFIARPFEGLPREAQWVALREIVPAATAAVRTTAEHGARGVQIVTLLPMMWPALHREDGVVQVALQTASSSGDASRDVAAALLEALDAEPGTPLTSGALPTPGPRLQDVLDLDAGLDVELHTGFDYWVAGEASGDAEVSAALEQADGAAVPTVEVDGVEAAYWCRMNGKEFVRWTWPVEEDALLDALARLQAQRATALDEGSKLIGAFRSCGLVTPVWELARGTEASELAGPAADFKARLEAALDEAGSLTADERRARAGLVSRQVTLR